jgi:hypothetical protein
VIDENEFSRQGAKPAKKNREAEKVFNPLRPLCGLCALA